MGSTDCGISREQHAPPAVLTYLKFSVLTEADIQNLSVLEVDGGADITNAKLGLPNEASECSTCGATDLKSCDGHFGVIKLRTDIFHPYYAPELVKILNSICPGCKCSKSEVRTKGPPRGNTSKVATDLSNSCNYCGGNSENFYPLVTFKLASRNAYGKVGSVIVEVNEKLPKKFKTQKLSDVLPPDFWKFIERDPSQEDISLDPNRRYLSPPQVYYLLKDVNPKSIEKLVRRRESLFLTCLPVTPNGNRLMETMNKVIFDERTKSYKRLADFNGLASDFGLRVRDCLGGSKIHSASSSDVDIKSGLKWIKDVVLAKRTDHSFRMVVVGDPNIKFGEIGISRRICQWLMVSETFSNYNQEKLHACCNWSLLETGEFRIRRRGDLITLKDVNALEMGDTVYRHLDEGDIVLVNRPPSIHQHSLIALSVRVLPMDSVVSLNPVCCSPLRGDFDGDCLHGFIPQSIRSTVELRELVAINHQLVDGQNGRNLLSLCHDSLTAAYLLRKKDIFLNKIEMQQLEMLCTRPFEDPAFRDYGRPAVLKASPDKIPLWTGKQLFGMLFPLCFEYDSPSNSVHFRDDSPSNSVRIREGEIMYSSLESSWLQNTDGNIFSSLVRSYGCKALDILFSVQGVLLEWISMRGFSVSLSDLYLCSDSYSRRKMLKEVYSGLDEAEQSFHTKQMMVDPTIKNILIHNEDNKKFEVLEVGNASHSKEVSDLNRLSVGAFKEVFRDLQSQILHYSDENNSLLAMVRAGSKGNLLKLVQQGVTLGLQHSSLPLSFSVPCKPSVISGSVARDTYPSSENSVPYAVVASSFLDGLNPMECFMHSVSSRSTSFADNADVPGTLHRNIMFYMRDLYLAYDGTVRNLNGNQLVQFSYGVSWSSDGCFEENAYNSLDFGGPVGSLAACSISEAAYSALDQPISTLESSPLLDLKKLLESSHKKKVVNQTVSLFLSKNLARWLYGFEYGAIKVKNHLERVLFSDVVTTVMITPVQQSERDKGLAHEGRSGYVTEPNHNRPWICHFHLCMEEMNKRGLNLHQVRYVLERECASTGEKPEFGFSKMQILCGSCLDIDQEGDFAPCITVAPGVFTGSPIPLDTFRNSVIPFLLRRVIKGFSEIKKVDISWNDKADASKSGNNSTGELYLTVHLDRTPKNKGEKKSSETFKNEKCLSLLMNRCLQIMDLIDWQRSSPNHIPDIYCAFGIDCARGYFLRSLKMAVSDIGKPILPEHLLLVADCLSVTGEFIGLNAKGIEKQRDLASVSSPFTQACFSRPESCFIKAAKAGAEDCLLGALDAAAWGKIVPLGTGGQFDISYSGKAHELTEPMDVYGTLSGPVSPKRKDAEIWLPMDDKDTCGKGGKESMFMNSFPILKEQKSGRDLRRLLVKRFHSMNFILQMIISLRHMLHNKYSINTHLGEEDEKRVMEALHYHPRSVEKIGSGVKNIKVDYHPTYTTSRCFFVVREDGSVEDFSYNKCVAGAITSHDLPADFVHRLCKAFPKK